jgi:pyruvate,orthophosphate dikinase
MANADTPEQALAAIAAGATGIGLCRTEALLLAPDRLRLMRTIASAATEAERRQALDQLLPLHRSDVQSIFQIVAPRPITIRLLDPPLQDFLPSLQQLDSELSGARQDENWDEYHSLNGVRLQHGSLEEVNPVMGHRGCRLSVTHPEILRMQVTAILEATFAIEAEGKCIVPGILVPLVASSEETAIVVNLIRRTADQIFRDLGKAVPYRIGALIELPRAAICAAEIAACVDFLAIGTNDLTQMTFGVSREDMGRYADSYLKQGIFKKDPFISLDQAGVGYLIEVATRSSRLAKPDIQIGVCGEHCNDGDSIRFLHSIGVSFLSCAISDISFAQREWNKISKTLG